MSAHEELSVVNSHSWFFFTNRHVDKQLDGKEVSFDERKKMVNELARDMMVKVMRSNHVELSFYGHFIIDFVGCRPSMTSLRH